MQRHMLDCKVHAKKTRNEESHQTKSCFALLLSALVRSHQSYKRSAQCPKRQSDHAQGKNANPIERNTVALVFR